MFAAFAAGVVVVHHERAAIGACAALALAIAALALDEGRRSLRDLCALACVAMLAGVVGGSLAAARGAALDVSALDGRHVSVEAVALERARAGPAGDEVRVRIRRIDANAGALAGADALLVIAGGLPARDVAGRELFVRARIDAPLGPRNEGETSERDLLADRGEAAVLSAASARRVRLGGAASGWDAWWARVRARMAAATERRLPAVEAAVLEGVLWGDRSDLPAALRQEFADTGTVHVLTTAGLHVGIMCALVAALSVALRLPRWVRVAVVLAAAWSYALLAGFHLPSARAATMLTAGLLAYETGRGRSPSAVLAAAAFAVALPHPLVVLSPSFAMSFACVGGLAVLSPLLRTLGVDAERLGVPPFAAECLRAGVAVQVALAPLQALYFLSFSPYAILANLIVVPLVGVVMGCGALAVAMGLALPAIAAPFFHLTWWVLDAIILVVSGVAALPLAHVDVPPPNHVAIALYWLGVAALAYAIQRGWSKRFGAALLAAAALAYVTPGAVAAFDPRLHVDVIDVGQADSILIRAPGMHAMLIDGGGKLERGASGVVVAQPVGDRIAARTVIPFMLRHWVLRLDDVVLTHPHGDHVGGLPLILARIPTGAVYDSAQPYGGPAYQRTLAVIGARRIRWLRARRGASGTLGNASFDLLAPEDPPITGTSSDINNNSVVVRLSFGRVAMLFTGDAQAEAEARMLRHGGADLRADVLKVGHHGSAYSSTPEFLAAVRPAIAVISCGRHNLFGHPSPRTLAALRAAGATVYRTDLDGGVRIDTDGVSVWARPSVPSAR